MLYELIDISLVISTLLDKHEMPQGRHIYLDANASATMRQSVGALLQRSANGALGANPSSVHAGGRKARADLRKAREAILNLLGAPTANLVFTSGGTEACNMMLTGFLGARFDGVHIISSPVEHAAVNEVLLKAEKHGAEISYAAIDDSGRVNADNVFSLLQDTTQLVCIMTANNETGVIQPVVEIAKMLREKSYKGLIVSDFTQAIGKSDIQASDLFEAGVDAIAVSGHKVGALSGIGALIYQSSETCRLFDALILGGPQEKGFRGGTENLLGALSFGAAATELQEKLEEELISRKYLREFFWQQLSSSISDLKRYGSEPLLSNTLLIGFSACNGGDLVAAFDLSGLASSTGSACSSGKQGVSETVKAIEPDAALGKEVVRFSLDWCTTKADIEAAVEIIKNCVYSVRESRAVA